MKVTDEDGKMTIDGEGDLVISMRGRGHALSMVRDDKAYPLLVTKFHFVRPNSPYRIVRMWQLLKFVWPYTA